MAQMEKSKTKSRQRVHRKKVLTVLDQVDLGSISDSKHSELYKKAEKISDAMLESLQKKNLAKSKFSYPDVVRQFAISLHNVSPAAYRYVRQALDFVLPDESTLRNWLRNVDVSTGFNKQSLNTLKDIVENEKMLGKRVYCCLIADEMHLKSHISFNGHSFDGKVDLGEGETGDDIATQALVFMVNCINGSWKIPIAHFFITKMSAEKRANLIRKAIELLNDSGVITVSVTSDNPTCNWKMFEILGANLYDINPKVHLDIKNSLGIPVFVTLDACHLIKLVRNCFGDYAILRNNLGEVISWDLIKRLHTLQRDQGLHLANKIGQKHMNYRDNKMKVSLAVQTLSNSVSKALIFCKDTLKIPEFCDSGATAEFCSYFNQIFDFLNSMQMYGRGHKNSLSKTTIEFFTQFVDEARAYILGLTHSDGKPVIKGLRRQAFLGFLVTMKSFLYIYKCYVQTSHLQYILSFKFSQDHLETFFFECESLTRQ